MKYEDVLNYINKQEDDELREILFDALNKQMPEDPIVEKYFYGEYYRCPSCNKMLMFGYPCRCGQMIDWRK